MRFKNKGMKTLKSMPKAQATDLNALRKRARWLRKQATFAGVDVRRILTTLYASKQWQNEAQWLRAAIKALKEAIEEKESKNGAR